MVALAGLFCSYAYMDLPWISYFTIYYFQHFSANCEIQNIISKSSHRTPNFGRKSHKSFLLPSKIGWFLEDCSRSWPWIALGSPQVDELQHGQWPCCKLVFGCSGSSHCFWKSAFRDFKKLRERLGINLVTAKRFPMKQSAVYHFVYSAYGPFFNLLQTVEV